MSNRSYFTKDPDAVLDYASDWTAWLADDEVITTANWTISTIDDDPDPLTRDSQTATDQVATVWLSGGTVGATYRATCRIVTDQGRTDDRTLSFTIRER